MPRLRSWLRKSARMAISTSAARIHAGRLRTRESRRARCAFRYEAASAAHRYPGPERKSPKYQGDRLPAAERHRPADGETREHDPVHAPRQDRKGNAWRLVYTGQEGVTAWRSTPELDAWVTYKSWHVELEEVSEFIEIPGNHALRFMPAALTKRTLHREAGMQFHLLPEVPGGAADLLGTWLGVTRNR